MGAVQEKMWQHVLLVQCPKSHVWWPSIAISHIISHPWLVHTALFSLYLSALFGKSLIGNRCDAKSRVVPDQVLIEFRWSPGTLCLLPDFNCFSHHAQDNLLWESVLRLQRGKINFVLFPSSVNVISVPISPGNLINCVTSSVSNLLTAMRPFHHAVTPQMGSRKHPNSFLCT